MTVPNFNRLSASCGVCVAALAMGCASAPREQLIDSQASLEAAQKMNAQEHPQAAYHLKLAQEKISKAKPMMDEGRDEKRTAKFLLVEAKNDADLAIEYAQTAEVREEAERAWSEIDELQQQGVASNQQGTMQQGGQQGGQQGQPQSMTQPQANDAD